MTQQEHRDLSVSQRVFGKNYEYFNDKDCPWVLTNETDEFKYYQKHVDKGTYYKRIDKR